MSGFKYVGADGQGGASSNLLTKGDLDAEFAGAAVTQQSAQAAIASAAASYASQAYVNTALNAFAQPSSLATVESLLIPTSQVGVAGGIAPLNSGGVIPAQFVPSLGAGYCSGPYSATATFAGSTGAAPLKIADWHIGAPGVSFQPLVFMTVLASASSGGRPVIEVRMSAGQQTYANQALVARGVGRNNWNDQQAITVIPAPAANGSAGGAGFAPTYDLWLSAWLYDANNQTVSAQISGILSTACFLIRYKQ